MRQPEYVINVSRLVRESGYGQASCSQLECAQQMRQWSFRRAFSPGSVALVCDESVPVWFVALLAHALHPRPVRLARPGLFRSRVLPACPPPSGWGGGPSGWRVSFGPAGALVAYELLRPRPAHLAGVIPPDVGAGRPVFLSGPGPFWLAVALAEAYAHAAPAVYLGGGPSGVWTCAITHSLEHSLGEQRGWCLEGDDELNGGVC